MTNYVLSQPFWSDYSGAFPAPPSAGVLKVLLAASPRSMREGVMRPILSLAAPLVSATYGRVVRQRYGVAAPEDLRAARDETFDWLSENGGVEKLTPPTVVEAAVAGLQDGEVIAELAE